MTRLHKLAMNSTAMDTFINEIKRFPTWFLTEEQKQYTKRDLRVFWTTIKELQKDGKLK